MGSPTSPPRSSTARGFLLGLALAALALAAPEEGAPPWEIGLVSGAYLVAGLLPEHLLRWTRGVALAATLLGLSLFGDALTGDPLAAFLGGVGAIVILAILWAALDPEVDLGFSGGAAPGALLPCLAVWLLTGPTRILGGPYADLGFALSLLLASLLYAQAALRDRSLRLWRRVPTIGLAVFPLLGIAALLLRAPVWSSAEHLLIAAVLGQWLLFGPGAVRRPLGIARRFVQSPMVYPAQLVVVSFLGAAAVGTLLLAFPAAATGARGIDLIDAAFTAMSAVCVTGLIVRDTATELSSYGQAVILLLIQIGGLGIMTLSAAVFGFIGRRSSLRHEVALEGVLGTSGAIGTRRMVRFVLAMTFSAELAGWLLLSALFLAQGDPPREAIWRGLFTAVSAFCNAGFSIQSDSLIPYQNTPAVLHVVAFLIIAGGLGPVGIRAIPRLLRKRPVDLVSKLIIFATLGLLASSFLAILALEWSHSLAGLSWPNRVHNAWFQAVTLRTAGFNSIEMTRLLPVTILVMAGFMFVGGSPGSTAGGIKTTTLAVLSIATLEALRGGDQARTGRRVIKQRAVYRALAVAMLGVAVVFGTTLCLLVTQQADLLSVLFEAVSAVGTVGLSTGATGLLDEFGKIVIMAAMFCGRVGPLSIFVLLQSTTSTAEWGLPEEDISVG